MINMISYAILLAKIPKIGGGLAYEASSIIGYDCSYHANSR